MKKILFVCLMCFSFMKAQVVISNTNDGSEIQALKGALLQVGNQNVNSTEITPANKGLIVPRVELDTVKALSPLVAVADSLGQNKIHSGMLVYNLKESAGLTKGLYYWDGKQWAKMLDTPPAEDGRLVSETLLFYSTLNELGVESGGTVNNPIYFSKYNFTIPGGALIANDSSYIDYLFRYFRTGNGIDLWWGVIKFTDTQTGVTFTYSLPGSTENLETGKIFFNQGEVEGTGNLSLVTADGTETVMTGITGQNDIVVSFAYYTAGLINKGNMDYARFNLVRVE
ncbi:hypothetical protein [Chryseobacterium sp. CT-SW4]|uniref:hypothetical protein n=1 Tax=Chryseobacterium sp. SW-1 TaxID=3157343 RepID=UPI003B029D48